MDIENIKLIGASALVLSSLMGSYYLILKIRGIHSEHPDPKLAYVTYSQMERVRAEMLRSLSDAVSDLRGLRAEIRDEARSMQKQFSRGILETRDLIGKNAQSISALAAQAEIANQRIGELTLKTDRLALRLKEEFE